MLIESILIINNETIVRVFLWDAEALAFDTNALQLTKMFVGHYPPSHKATAGQAASENT